MNVFNYIFANIFIALCVLSVVSCRDVLMKQAKTLIESETKRLEEDGIKCSSPTYYDLQYFRILQEYQQALSCHLVFLSSQSSDSWAWSSLGEVYKHISDARSSKHSALCFKQAASLGGVRVSEKVSQWYFIGPFSIGKGEVDGDPLASHGGIKEVARGRLEKKKSKHYQIFQSELVAKGDITWIKLPASKPEQPIQINNKINWNELINDLGSLGVTEWQGWAVGEFAVNDNNADVIIQCLGVHTLFVNDIILTGDVYLRKQYWFSVNLSRGIHTIYIKVRAKGNHAFDCNIKDASEKFELLLPSFLPDLWHGFLFSSYLALPISNYQSDHWLKINKVKIQGQSAGEALSVQTTGNFDDIAPGQTLLIPLRITAENRQILPECGQSVKFTVKVLTSQGQQSIPLILRCRERQSSFIFTFKDHDGSIQQAAAIQPFEGECDEHVCPVVLTLHGTTVPPQNQADSYKYMVNGEFVFGFPKAWLVAPTRHGAHNWEGVGALTALKSVENLKELVDNCDWCIDKLSPDHVIYAGHSMGGHGALHLATHFPDQGLAVVSLAGWLKKEDYGESNLFFRHDISTSYVDPTTKSIMESCIAENNADNHASNLEGLSVMLRIGARDKTMPPYFTRRMYRVLREWNVNVTYTELSGKEHWWWDTWKTNDGGAVNDEQLRNFTNSLAVIPSVNTPFSCDLKDQSECEETSAQSVSYAKEQLGSFTFTLFNPAFAGSKHGFRILQQLIPHSLTKIKVEAGVNMMKITTTNVRRFSMSPSKRYSLHNKVLEIDGLNFTTYPDMENACFIKSSGSWLQNDLCDDFVTRKERGPMTLGPARRIAESAFLIVTGTQGNLDDSESILQLAVYLANLFMLTSDTHASVIKDVDLTSELEDEYNLIILGDANLNSYSEQFLRHLPLRMDDHGLHLENCNFTDSRTGLLSLAPHQDDKLALLLMGRSMEALKDIITLASPTIPPMTRSPFSNMIPDFIITGPQFEARGPGGYLCSGFWGHKWQFLPEVSSCAHCFY